MSHGVARDFERHGRAVAIALVAVGLALRWRGISEYWLNADEGIYYSTLTRASIDAFWVEVWANAHPPGYYVLLRLLGFLTWDFVWLRASSMVFGAAAIWLFWLVGRELGGGGTRGVVSGLTGAALLALNGEAIVLSQVIRPYSLVVLLLAGALLNLLRYRREPKFQYLVGYATLLGFAVVSHYSAAMAIGVFSLVVLHDAMTRHLPRSAMGALLGAHAIPILLLGALYVAHLGPALRSELVRDALDVGGWLDAWLIDSPATAWRSLLAYQAFNLPPSFRVRAVIVASVAVIVSVASRERTPALLVTGAIAIAIVASALGVYPFGPTRHGAWLMVFTIPGLGWLAGASIAWPRRRTVVAGGALLILLVAGAPIERALGGPESGGLRTNATEERVIRRADLAPLIVEHMAPSGEPEIILMSEQSYNLLMPLYPSDRELVTPSRDGSAFYFDYGDRQIVVTRQWDFAGAQDLARTLERFPDLLTRVERSDPPTVLAVVGGWGSSILPQAAGLARLGVVIQATTAIGSGPDGRGMVRMMALVFDFGALSDLAAAG